MSTKKPQSDKFLNIPRDWVYLIGYKYPVINRYREPKLNKNKEQITKRIDYVDLLLMDEIRGFKERGNKECFKEANALAESVGMYGNERIICDKVLQLCNLGFIKAYRKIDDKQRTPRIVLETNTDVVNSVATAMKEQIETEKRMHSQHGDFLGLLRKNNILQEYLQEYLQEDLQEPLPEQLQEQLPEHQQEPLHEDSQEPLPEPLQVDSQEHLKEELQKSTEASKTESDDCFSFDDPNVDTTSDDGVYGDFYILDGKTDEEIISECRRRINVLSDILKGKFNYLIDDVIFNFGKYNSHLMEDISKSLSDATKDNLSKQDINNLVKVVNYLSSSYLRDSDLQNYANGDLQLKHMATKEYVDHIDELPF